jgi:hypothetical protein
MNIRIGILASAALLLSGDVMAQDIWSMFKQRTGQEIKHRQTIQRFLNSNGVRTSARPTALKQRLIATSQVTGSMGVSYQDTSRLYYTGTRGSQFDHNGFQYYTDLTAFNPLMAEIVAGFPNYSSTVEADSIIYQVPADNYLLTQKAFYNPGGKMDSTRFVSDGFNQLFVYGYDGGGVLNQITSFSPSGDTVAQRRIYYTANHSKILADTIQTWNIINPAQHQLAYWDYQYTGEKLESARYFVISDTLNELERQFNFTYYPGGALQTVRNLELFDGVLGFEAIDSFVYKPGVEYVAEWYNFDVDPFTGVRSGEHVVKTFNAAGLTDSIYVFGRESDSEAWVEFVRGTMSYNEFDNPTELAIFGELMGDEMTGVFKMYYETYDDGVSVNGVTAKAGALKAFPNPFKDQVELIWEGSATKQDVRVLIYNSLGQKLHEVKLQLQPGANRILIPAHLASGHYMLKVQDNAGQQWQSKLLKH